jgi:hypothetical protein
LEESVLPKFEQFIEERQYLHNVSTSPLRLMTKSSQSPDDTQELDPEKLLAVEVPKQTSPVAGEVTETT